MAGYTRVVGRRRCVTSFDAPNATQRGRAMVKSERSPTQQRARAALPAALLVGLGAGCFSPDFTAGACAVPCSEGCPVGWKCRDSRCVPPDFTASCSSGGGAAGASADGSGGTSVVQGGSTNGSLSAGESGQGGGDSHGGESSYGGASSGGRGGASDGLTLEPLTTPLAPACTGRDTVVQLYVTGGVPPYSLKLESDTCGLSETSGAGSHFQLRGKPSAVGRCETQLRAVDSRQRSGRATVSLDVHETPRLTTDTLPAACPFEEYSAMLAAEGGNSANYSFSVSLPADMEWVIRGAALTGYVDFQTRREISAWVDDGYCESDHRSLSLSLEPDSSSACPRIQPGSGPDRLPRPCYGMDYRVVFDTLGVTKWEALELPPGLELKEDSSFPLKLILAGSAEWPPGTTQTLRLRIANAAERSVIARYSLSPRDKCWLGYVSRQDGSWQLHLADPELRVRRSFPSASSASVSSFAFAPDGEFVAYTRESAGAPTDLVVLNLRNLREQPLNLGGSVAEYSWAPDGSVLVARVETDTQGPILAGVDVSANRGANGASEPAYLEPSAFSGEAGFTWFGERSLAYLVPSFVPSRLSPEYTEVVGGAFDTVVTLDNLLYRPPVELTGFAHGLVLSNAAELDYLSREPVGDTLLFLHKSNTAAFAPSGRYVARTAASAASTLQLLHATSDTPFATSESGQCGAVLAWSNAPERVACVVNVEGGGEVRIFAAASPGPRVGSFLARGEYKAEYLESSAEQRRRVFSPRGGYLAFTNDSALYVSHVSEGGTTNDFRRYSAWDTAATPSGENVDLAFSADDQFLIQQRGGSLTLHDLAQPSERRLLLDDAMRVPAACSERYMGHLASWCGRLAEAEDFKWSPHGPLVAFRNADGALQVLEIFSGSRTGDRLILNPSCSSDCLRSFAFQP